LKLRPQGDAASAEAETDALYMAAGRRNTSVEPPMPRSVLAVDIGVSLPCDAPERVLKIATPDGAAHDLESASFSG